MITQHGKSLLTRGVPAFLLASLFFGALPARSAVIISDGFSGDGPANSGRTPDTTDEPGTTYVGGGYYGQPTLASNT